VGATEGCAGRVPQRGRVPDGCRGWGACAGRVPRRGAGAAAGATEGAGASRVPRRGLGASRVLRMGAGRRTGATEGTGAARVPRRGRAPGPGCRVPLQRDSTVDPFRNFPGACICINTHTHDEYVSVC